MTKEEQQFNQWFDWYADGVKVFEEADMKQAYLQGRAELEKENTELERKLEQTEKDLADYQFNYPTIKELEAEVKEWKDKADLWCKTANLKDHNIMINKELEKENAELKADNQKLKDEWQEQVQKATDEGYARTLQTIQLTKAKELLKRCHDNYIYLQPLRNDIEQFISEVEK